MKQNTLFFLQASADEGTNEDRVSVTNLIMSYFEGEDMNENKVNFKLKYEICFDILFFFLPNFLKLSTFTGYR